eukprot:435284-Rhodomonas_salina.1
MPIASAFASPSSVTLSRVSRWASGRTKHVGEAADSGGADPVVGQVEVREARAGWYKRAAGQYQARTFVPDSRLSTASGYHRDCTHRRCARAPAHAMK